ncbi:MAG: hypothetical protein LUF32_08055, partial [Clostridiales bacterium]|nr:hypothetical protein [Clostridiales bacterium]
CDGDGVDAIRSGVVNVYYFYYEEGSETADVVVAFGRSTDEVVVGDWDGDGIDTLAVRRYDNHYYFQAKLNSDELYADVTFGKADDEILAGDWDGDGIDTLAARRKASGDYSVNHYYFQSDVSKDETYADIYYGKNDDEVLTGDWNGDGMDTLAVRRDGNHYYFQENLEDVWCYIDTYFGRATDEVLAGLWI